MPTFASSQSQPALPHSSLQYARQQLCALIPFSGSTPASPDFPDIFYFHCPVRRRLHINRSNGPAASKQKHTLISKTGFSAFAPPPELFAKSENKSRRNFQFLFLYHFQCLYKPGDCRLLSAPSMVLPSEYILLFVLQVSPPSQGRLYQYGLKKRSVWPFYTALRYAMIFPVFPAFCILLKPQKL